MMSLKQSFSNLLSFCIANKIGFSIWRFPNSDELSAILSDTFHDEKPCDLTNDRGFCISKFDNKGSYILLKPKVELKINRIEKTIKIIANDEKLITSLELKKLITSSSTLTKQNVISSSFEQTNKQHFTQTVQSVIDNIKGLNFDKVVISKFKEEAITNEEIPFLFKKLYEEGLSIKTPIDVNYQIYAQEALRNTIESYDKRHGWRGAITNRFKDKNFCAIDLKFL